MYNLPRTYNNCNTTVDSSEHTRKLSSTISSCNACVQNTECCEVNAIAISYISNTLQDLSATVQDLSANVQDLSANVQDISSHLLTVDASINYLYSFDLSNVIVTIEDISQNVYDNSQSIIVLNTELDDLSGVVQDLSATVQDLSANVQDLSGEIYSLPGVVSDLSAVVLDLSGDFNNLSTAFTDLSGTVADLSSNKVDRAGDTMTGNLNVNGLTLGKSGNAIINTSGTDNLNITTYENLILDISNTEIQFLGENGSVRSLSSHPFTISSVRSGGYFPSTTWNQSSITNYAYSDINFNTDASNINIMSIKNNRIENYKESRFDEGLLINTYTPSTTASRLYNTGTNLYWDTQPLSIWDESGTSLVLDACYNELIIPGSTTQLGVDRTNKIAYLETDLSNIKFIVQGNNAVSIDNSSIDISGTVNFSDTLTAKQGIKISTYTSPSTTQTLYTINGTDLFWNGSIIGSDISAVVYDLSTVVLDLSSDFNTLSIAFTDLSGDLNTLSTTFTDLSGVVADLSSNKVSKSGDTMTGNLNVNGLTLGKSGNAIINTSGTDNLNISAYDTMRLDLSNSQIQFLGENYGSDTSRIISNTPFTVSSVRGGGYFPTTTWTESTINNYAFSNINFKNSNPEVLVFSISGDTIQNYKESSFDNALLINNYTPSITTNRLYTPNSSDLYWNGSIIGSDISAVVYDLSNVVLDLSDNFNTHLTVFTDLSGTVDDLSGTVADLSGTVADLSGTVSNLSGVVADLSSNKVSKSGDTMTGNLNVNGLTLGKSGNAIINTSGTDNLNISAYDTMILDLSNSQIQFLGENYGSDSSRIISNTPFSISSVRSGGYFPSTNWSGSSITNYAFSDINFNLNATNDSIMSIRNSRIENYKESRFDEGLLINNYTPSTTTSRLYNNGSDLYWDNHTLSIFTTSGTNIYADASYDTLWINNSTRAQLLNGSGPLRLYSGGSYSHVLDMDNGELRFDVCGNNIFKVAGNAIGTGPLMTLRNQNPSSSETSIQVIDPTNSYFIRNGMTNTGLGFIYMNQTNRFRLASNSGNILETYDTSLNLKRNLIIDGSDNSTIYSQILNTSTSGNAKLQLTSLAGTQGTTELICGGTDFELKHRGNIFLRATGTSTLDVFKPMYTDGNTFGTYETNSNIGCTIFNTNMNFRATVSSTLYRFDLGLGVGTGNVAAFGIKFYNKPNNSALHFQVDLCGNIAARSYSNLSDRRIKTNIELIPDGSSVEIVKKIEPKQYNYFDNDKDEQKIYGFIAQEVREVFPQAVNISNRFIPDILKNVIINGNKLTFETDTELIIGKRLRINGVEDENMIIFAETKLNSKEYLLNQDLEINKTLFCYGHYVDDFHYLNTIRLVPVLWSATQQVIKEQDLLKLKVQTLEIEKDVLINKVFTLEQDNTSLKQNNTALKQDNTALKQDNDILKQQVADMESRLKLIEEKLNL